MFIKKQRFPLALTQKYNNNNNKHFHGFMNKVTVNNWNNLFYAEEEGKTGGNKIN